RAARAIHVPMRESIGPGHSDDGRIRPVLDRHVLVSSADGIRASGSEQRKRERSDQQESNNRSEKRAGEIQTRGHVEEATVSRNGKAILKAVVRFRARLTRGAVSGP